MGGGWGGDLVQEEPSLPFFGAWGKCVHIEVTRLLGRATRRGQNRSGGVGGGQEHDAGIILS